MQPELLFDYATLRIIWWVILGILLIGFAVMDGFDLGTASLLPFVARNDEERRIVVNTIGPVWEGNQVWLVLGAGAIFAAWPPLYATAFSAFYVAMLLALLPLIIRPVGFKFRGKVADPRWRSFWDWALCSGAALTSFVFGVAVGNALLGIEFHFTPWQLPVYTGGFFDLFSLFAVLSGLLAVSMFVMHGGAWLRMKTDEAVQRRATNGLRIAALLTAMIFTVNGLLILLNVDGYTVTGGGDPNGPSSPFLKVVSSEPGAWFNNFLHQPLLSLVPAAGILCPLLIALFGSVFAERLIFRLSAVTVIAIVATPGLAMFPFLLPSSSDPGHSLVIWDASSSHRTLFNMLIATAIFMPLILAYTAWVYRVLGGKMTKQRLHATENAY